MDCESGSKWIIWDCCRETGTRLWLWIAHNIGVFGWNYELYCGTAAVTLRRSCQKFFLRIWKLMWWWCDGGCWIILIQYRAFSHISTHNLIEFFDHSQTHPTSSCCPMPYWHNRIWGNCWPGNLSKNSAQKGWRKQLWADHWEWHYSLNKHLKKAVW